MSDKLKNELQTIDLSDTLSDFVRKCNENFNTISALGGGPAGVEGNKGEQGVPAKPKVPIHVWREKEEYENESIYFDEYILNGINVDLTSDEYQDRHLIMLQNGHVYMLEVNDFTLKPKYIFTIQSNSQTIDDKKAYVHIAYSKHPNGIDPETGDNSFIREIDIPKNNTESVSTFNLKRSNSTTTSLDMPYMGIYTNNSPTPSHNAKMYTWIRIQGAKELQNIEVFVDKRVVNTSTSQIHSLKVGYYIISSNDTKKFIGNHNEENNIKGYQIKLTDDIANLPSTNVVDNWEEATYDFVLNGKNRNCYVVLVDSDGAIVDYTNVTAINDGNSAIHLELSKDHIVLPSIVDGSSVKVHPNYNDTIGSRMLLYNGDKLIDDYSNITYIFKINGETTNKVAMESDGFFNVSEDIIIGNVNIECIATYNETSFHKILSIDLEETPYVLELNKNVLSRDVNIGEITDGSLMARVKYWMNGGWVYTNDGVVKASTDKIEDIYDFDIPNPETFHRILIIDDSNLKLNIEDTEVRISYCSSNNITDEITYQIIGIVDSGKNGDSPFCESVKIIGYSLNENEDINDINKWVSSIDELGSLNEGQPIYILNEYTWSNGKTTTGVTVTLSGTQGTDGKSGKTIYPSGKWDNETTYKTTETTAPYVIHNDEYWLLNVDESVNNEPSDESTHWIKFDKFEAIFAKVGIVENGTFGSAVFNGNYMFSQNGCTHIYKTNAKGEILYQYPPEEIFSDDYFNFDPDDPFGVESDIVEGNVGTKFFPNFCVNFLTGETHIGKHSIVSKNSNEGYIGGDRYPAIKWDSSNVYMASNTDDEMKSGLTMQKSTGVIIENALTKIYTKIYSSEAFTGNNATIQQTSRILRANGQEWFIHVNNDVALGGDVLFYSSQSPTQATSGKINLCIEPIETGKVADIVLFFEGNYEAADFNKILFNYRKFNSGTRFSITNTLDFYPGFNFYSLYYFDNKMYFIKTKEHVSIEIE